MALSSNSTWLALTIEEVVSIASATHVVKTSSVIYHGALCSHDTLSGAIEPFDGTQANRIVGWHFGDSVTGNTSAADPPRATIRRGGFRVRGLTVAGLVGNATDYGVPVYATADGTYTRVDPGSGQKIGQVESDTANTSSTATVYFFPVGAGV